MAVSRSQDEDQQLGSTVDRRCTAYATQHSCRSFTPPIELASLRRVRYAPMLRHGKALDLSHAPLDGESDDGGASVMWQ